MTVGSDIDDASWDVIEEHIQFLEDRQASNYITMYMEEAPGIACEVQAAIRYARRDLPYFDDFV